METLKGKVAIVTGGGGGLGQATCRTLAAAGAIVISADVSRDLAENVCGAIRAEGGRVLPCRLDVTAEGQVEQVIDQVVAEHGRLDVLINNAGVDVTAPIEDLSVADWDRIIDVNLRGPFLMSRKALGVMRRQGSGPYRQHRLDGRPAGLGQRVGLSREQMGTAGLQPCAARRGTTPPGQGDRRDCRRHAYPISDGAISRP